MDKSKKDALRMQRGEGINALEATSLGLKTKSGLRPDSMK